MSCDDLAEDLLGGPNGGPSTRCLPRSKVWISHGQPLALPSSFSERVAGDDLASELGRCGHHPWPVFDHRAPRPQVHSPLTSCQPVRGPFSGALQGTLVAPINAAAGQDGCSLRKPSMPSNISLKTWWPYEQVSFRPW